MATTYMKLPYEDRVLRPDALHPLRLSSGIVGFTLDVRLNYYRGLPLSAVENLELSVDGVRVPDHLVLAGLREKIFPLGQVRLAFTEHWPVKGVLRLSVYNGGLEPGPHQVNLTLNLRNVYMQFAPGVWGMIDGSASRELVLQEAA
jgi:Domain of unknown function (DUF6379)